MKLEEFFDEVYVPSRLIDGSEFSIMSYKLAISTAKKALNREPKLSDLNGTFLTKVAGYCREHHLAAGTLKNRITHLRCIWRRAHEEKLVRELPPKMRVKEPKQIKPAWTTCEISSLIRSAQQERKMIEGIEASKWWTCLILVTYDTGARRRVLMNTPLCNVSWEYRAVLLPHRAQKQRADQYCGLSDETIKLLMEIRDPSRRMLFPWGFDKSAKTSYPSLTYHFRRIVKRAGLDPDDGLFHRLRRSRASYGELMQPGSATRDLGHSDRKVTERYLDPKILGISRVVDLIPRPQL